MDHKFSFRRARGVVWVCDLTDSSKRLNDNTTAAELEAFLPRLHWLAITVVEAAGGVFLKWTGDGFLAWFETPLHRELPDKANALFEAIWHLTFFVNTTNLETSPTANFRLRHGVAYEHDALLTTITDAKGHEELDITGRAVVLAFRLSGIPAHFPNLVVDRAVAKAASVAGTTHIPTKAWIPKREELLRYFKGERWGTTGLAVSVAATPRKSSLPTLVRRVKKIIVSVEPNSSTPTAVTPFLVRFCEAMLRGPEWAKSSLRSHNRFLKDEMLQPLKFFAENLISKSRATKQSR